MDDALKRLLDAEAQAELITEDANKARDKAIQKTIQEGRQAEQRFESRIPEIRAAFLEKAETRAEQAIAEMRRRFDEQKKELETLAHSRAEEAVNAALKLVLPTDTDADK